MLVRRLLSLSAVLIFSSFIFLTGCKDSVLTSDLDVTTDRAAIEKIATEDSSLLTFETNYNEDGSLDFIFGKTQVQIFPIRVVRRVVQVNRAFVHQIIGDSAYVTAKYTFRGNLIIAASYDSVVMGDTSAVDTIIVKPFTTSVTRKLIFAKFANEKNAHRNWKLVAVSLPEGGTNTRNIVIQKATLVFPNETIVITSPNDYFMSKVPGKIKQIPSVGKNETVTIYAEVYSAYAADDFVSLTYGADIKGLNRIKKRFVLESVTPSGNGFLKVYKQTLAVRQNAGHFHAVISAIPRDVIYDDQAPYESKSWGIPYSVR